jgi:hypothetical protein
MLGGQMTAAERVMEYLVRHRNTWLCDDCIADALKLPNRREIPVVTSAIGKGAGYRRLAGTCSACAGAKLATKAG